jgi:hypothetical protein
LVWMPWHGLSIIFFFSIMLWILVIGWKKSVREAGESVGLVTFKKG